MQQIAISSAHHAPSPLMCRSWHNNRSITRRVSVTIRLKCSFALFCTRVSNSCFALTTYLAPWRGPAGKVVRPIPTQTYPWMLSLQACPVRTRRPRVTSMTRDRERRSSLVARSKLLSASCLPQLCTAPRPELLGLRLGDGRRRRRLSPPGASATRSS